MCVKELYNLVIIRENKSVYKYLLRKIIIAVVLNFHFCATYNVTTINLVAYLTSNLLFLTSIGQKI